MDNEYYIEITKRYILVHDVVKKRNIAKLNLNRRKVYFVSSKDFSKLKELKEIINKSLCEYYDLLDEIKEENPSSDILDQIYYDERAGLERIKNEECE